MLFLTHDELQQLTGYAPNQRKRICKWLSEHGIPYHTNRLGDPAVFRNRPDGPHKALLEVFLSLRHIILVGVTVILPSQSEVSKIFLANFSRSIFIYLLPYETGLRCGIVAKAIAPRCEGAHHRLSQRVRFFANPHIGHRIAG